MRSAELRSAVLLGLADALSTQGFRCWPKDQAIWRPGPGIKQAIHLAYVPHRDDFSFLIDVAVRHDGVEDAVGHQRHLPARERRRTYTVGAELGNLAGSGQQRWTVANKEDVGRAVGDAFRWIQRVGLPFLERFASLPTTIEVLESGSREAVLICPLPDQRQAVVAAGRDLLRKRAV